VNIIVNDTHRVELEQKSGQLSEPHPHHAAAAPGRHVFAELGPIIATGHPCLQGIQVRGE
jgi:hypothetical protein